ncbi:hypothetical protein FQA39_LY09220 [Lamprigera yunnana]|nr:hypothetical protein FQA39_LY09220 [Lamprigera yunnana]
MSAPELLPLTDDLVTLNKYLETLIKEGLGKINNSFNPQLWARLANSILCQIILFNKSRSGEASRMTITQYAATPNWKELTATLTPLKMNLANRLTVVKVPGKSRSLYEEVARKFVLKHLRNPFGKNISNESSTTITYFTVERNGDIDYRKHDRALQR